MTLIPDNVAEAVRNAATPSIAYSVDLQSLRRRAARRRRRHQAAAAACAAALVGVGAVTIPAALSKEPPAGTLPVAPAADGVQGQRPPAQRLLLHGGGHTWEIPGKSKAGITNSGGQAEMRADGSVVRHAIPGVDGWYGAFGLADGELVVLGHTDLRPGTAGEDGPDVAGLSIELKVLRADGSVELTREVRVKGEGVSLVAADRGSAYLVRPSGLLSHDLATGREEPILPAAALTGADGRLIDVSGNAVAVLDGCQVRVFARSTGQQRTQASLPCTDAAQVRLSPDGRLAAVAYRTRDELRITVLDTETGASRATRTLPTVPQPAIVEVYGIAWTESTSVRVAWASLPRDADRLYQLEELLKSQTVSVQ
ncbi:hypothetical protein K1W54_07605 [Micromonospora sp. CPCC 205371]|nr:hypothetical protein [Micromonospora sp. CPCC 205371]